MSNLFDIKDYVVVITGGTGVLGKTIAKYLALEGAKVAILGRKEEVGNAIVEDIKQAGGEASFFKTDVMNKEIVEQNCKDILAKYGKVDTLLNAAGGNMKGATIGPDQTFFDLDTEQFQTVLNLNLTGTVIPTQVFLKPMVEAGKGSIINFSSMAAFRPMTRVCGYAAAKAGISNFTAYMAVKLEMPRSLVRVSVLMPLLQVSSSPSRTVRSLPIPTEPTQSAERMLSARLRSDVWVNQKNSAALSSI